MWDNPVEILEAMGYNPATADPVHQGAAHVLAALCTGEFPVDVDLHDSKGTILNVVDTVRAWLEQLHIEPCCPLIGWQRVSVARWRYRVYGANGFRTVQP